MRRLAVLLLALAPACTSFPSPAELSKPTVLAVIADPPLVAPGATSQLSVVMVSADGVITPDTTTWSLIPTLPDVPPFGTVTAGATGAASYTAPNPVPTQPDGAPPLATVKVTVTAGDESVDVLKGMLVVAVPSANPTITALTIGGNAAADGMQLTSGQSYDLKVTTDPASDDKSTYAWYSTAGTIDHYQSNPCTLVAGDKAASDWLFVVVRDGKGGVAWHGVQVTVK